MKKLAVTMAALACAATLGTSFVIAQPAGPGAGGPPPAAGAGPGGPGGPGWGPGMMMGPGMMGWGGRGGMGMLCDPRAAGMAEWRMERIEKVVQPTEAQRAALNDLRTASTKAAEQISAACPREFPASAIVAHGADGEAARDHARGHEDRAAGVRCVLRDAQRRAEDEARPDRPASLGLAPLGLAELVAGGPI